EVLVDEELASALRHAALHREEASVHRRGADARTGRLERGLIARAERADLGLPAVAQRLDSRIDGGLGAQLIRTATYEPGASSIAGRSPLPGCRAATLPPP